MRVHQESRRRDGCRRVTHALRAPGGGVNVKRVVRHVMRESSRRGVRQGRFVPRTTDQVPIGAPSPPTSCRDALASRPPCRPGRATSRTWSLAKADCPWR